MPLLLWCKTPHCKTRLILGHRGSKITPRVWKDREVEYLLRQTPTQWIPRLIILAGVIENMAGSREELGYRMCRILLEESPPPNSPCPDFSSYPSRPSFPTPPFYVFLLWVSLWYLKFSASVSWRTNFIMFIIFTLPQSLS